MNELNEKQKAFFEKLKSIQEVAVYQSLNENKKEKDNVENLLYDATYEVIVSICTLLDGYNDKFKLELIDKETLLPLRLGIELHDVCADYLKWEK